MLLKTLDDFLANTLNPLIAAITFNQTYLLLERNKLLKNVVSRGSDNLANKLLNFFECHSGLSGFAALALRTWDDRIFSGWPRKSNDRFTILTITARCPIKIIDSFFRSVSGRTNVALGTGNSRIFSVNARASVFSRWAWDKNCATLGINHAALLQLGDNDFTQRVLSSLKFQLHNFPRRIDDLSNIHRGALWTLWAGIPTDALRPAFKF